MTDTFDAVLAKDREIIRQFFAHEKNRVGDYWGERTAKEAIDRLAAAHAAEVVERDAMLREVEVTLENCAAHMTTLRARAEAAERDARELRVDIAKAYAMVPELPVAPETCDAATDALHWVGLMMGRHDIDPAIATTEQAATGARDG